VCVRNKSSLTLYSLMGETYTDSAAKANKIILNNQFVYAFTKDDNSPLLSTRGEPHQPSIY